MRNQIQNKIKLPPFFKKGTLKYKNSEHKLTLSDGYYRCSLNCKGKCSNKEEKQLKKGVLERKFSRMASKFEIRGDGIKLMRKEIMRQMLLRMIDELDYEDNKLDEFAEITFTVIKQEANAGKKIKKSDIKDFQEAFIKQQIKDYPLVLFGYLGGVIMAFSEPEKEVEIGKALALITREILISNSGEITSLELEKWGWYILNFIDKKFPNYIHTIKKKGINILNKPEEITSLDLSSAIKYMQEKIMLPAFQSEKSILIYSFSKLLNKLARGIANGNTDDLNKEIINLCQLFRTDFSMDMAAKISQAQNAKLS